MTNPWPSSPGVTDKTAKPPLLVEPLSPDSETVGGERQAKRPHFLRLAALVKGTNNEGSKVDKNKVSIHYQFLKLHPQENYSL